MRSIFLLFVCLWCLNAHAFGTKKSDAADSAGSSSGDTTWVSRKDGGTSCGVVKAQTLEEGAQELRVAGVAVLDSRKASDGKMHALACGMPTGSMNAYQISRSDLNKASGLGFREMQ